MKYFNLPAGVYIFNEKVMYVFERGANEEEQEVIDIVQGKDNPFVRILCDIDRRLRELESKK